jgi:hypothetical protein
MSEGDEPWWNFYISDVSDRYSFMQNIIGIAYDGGNYFTKYETLTGISGSVALENNPEDWMFHQEKLQPSPLGEAAGIVYCGFSTINAWEGKGLDGLMVYRTEGNGIDPEEGFKAYLNNPFDENPSDLLVFPGIVDHIEIDPEWGDEVVYFIKGNAIVAGDDNEVIYGSGVSSYGNFLSNQFYVTETEFRVLPFHPQFSFTSTDNPDVKQGNNTPIAVVAGNTLMAQYKGRYGETRESDFFNTHVEVKQNDNVVFSGSFIDDFENYTLPETGNFEVTYTNTNIEVEGLAGKNITRLQFDKGQEDAVPPTLQHLQFRTTDGKVTDRFVYAAEGTLRLAAGDFQYVPINEYNGYYDYNEGNTVEMYYSLFDQNSWTELELTKYPEYFQMPAFGDYYEASLSEIEYTNIDAWYDVKIVCTDAAGNKQEQVVSPAFKIKNTVGVKETVNSSGVFYPNPVTDILTVENPGNKPSSVNIVNTTGEVVYSGPVTNESTQSINMKTLNIPDGIYLIQLITDSKTTTKKIIFKN